MDAKQFMADAHISRMAHLKLDPKEMIALAQIISDMRDDFEARMYYMNDAKGLPVAYFAVCPKECGTVEDVAGSATQIFNLTNPCPPFC